MNKQRILLAQRRERLVDEIAVQRVVLEQGIEPWRAPLALADRGITALQYIRSHPQWLLGGVVLFVALRPARVGKWVGRGLVAWQMLHRLQVTQRYPEDAR